MYVNVNTSVIKQQAKYIGDNLEGYASGVNNVKNTVNSIGTIWKDAGYKNFVTKMEEFIRELQDLEKTLQSYQNFANGYADAHEALDSNYGNKEIKLR